MPSMLPRVLAGLLIACWSLPVSAQAPAAATPAPAASPVVMAVPETPRSDTGASIDRRLLAIGAGAIAATVAFNLLTGPLGTVPYAGAVLDTVPYSVALGSRLIATATAGGGALAATYAYDRWTGTERDYKYLLSLAAGALGGVAIGNVLSGTIGMLPYYPGAGMAATAAGDVAASAAAQAASRVYVIASGVFGAWAGDWLYRRSAGPASATSP